MNTERPLRYYPLTLACSQRAQAAEAYNETVEVCLRINCPCAIKTTLDLV